MKKIVFASVAALALAVPAIANATGAAPAAPVTPAAPAATAPAPAMTAPAMGTATALAPATTAETTVELKDGSWAKVASDGVVMVSNDGGKSWAPAPDGTWVSKDGLTTINVKSGKKV